MVAISEEAPAGGRRHRRKHRARETTGKGVLPAGVEAGLYILLIATPLALGSVSRTATALMEGACFALLVVSWWAGMDRRVTTRIPRAFKVAAAGFVCWTLLQMIPMPASVLRWVSPGTHRLYEENLPGYASREGSEDLQSWLLERRDTASAELTPRPENRTGMEGRMKIPARWEPISWYPGRTLRWLFRFLAYAALFLLVVKFMPERACRKRLPRLLLLLGFGIAVFGILQNLTWNGKIYWFIRVYKGNPFGPWVNNNHFSGYLEMVLPLGIAVLVQAGPWKLARRRWHSRRITVPLALLTSFSLLWIVAALLMARSRGGLFSLLFTLLLYFMAQVMAGQWRDRHRRLAPVLAVLPLLLALAGATAYVVRSGAHEDALAEEGLEPSLASRVVAWRGVMSMVAADPLSGTGLGTFGLAYPVFKTYGSTGFWKQAHNDYLQALAESGLVGFAFFLVGTISLFRRYLVPVFRSPWRSQEPVAVAAGLGLVTLLIHSMVDFNLQIPSNGLLFVLLGGLLVRLQAIQPPASAEEGQSEQEPEMAGNP